MTDTLTTAMLSEDDFLEHYGVKGMKWGVLRDQAAAGDRGAQKKLDKADRKWEASSHGTSAYIAVHNKMADAMNNGAIDKFNSNPKYKGIKDFRDGNDPRVKEYLSDFDKLTSKYFAQATKDTYGESPSGRYSCEVKKNSDGYYYAEMVDSQAAAHAVDLEPVKFALKQDADGRIIGIGDPIEDSVKHQEGNTMADTQLSHGMLSEEDFLSHIDATPDMTEDEFLEHFGVKGMRWGQRKAEGSGSGGSDAGGGGRRPKLTADGREKKSGKELRALNKESAKRDVAKNDADIDAARTRIASGENRKAYLEAKARYKSDKHVIGRREAAKAYQAVKDKNLEDYNKSQEAKSGRETVGAVIGTVAGLVLIGVGAALQS